MIYEPEARSKPARPPPPSLPPNASSSSNTGREKTRGEKEEEKRCPATPHAVHMLCTCRFCHARASHVNVPSDVATTDSRELVLTPL